MTIWGLKITEWIALLGFAAGIIFGLMKFYNLFMQLDSSIKTLNKLINTLKVKFDDHEIRITRLEEQSKTLFRDIGGKRNEK